jgi:hypothetical protein
MTLATQGTARGKRHDDGVTREEATSYRARDKRALFFIVSEIY